jgi:hypothetical protein
MSHIVHRKENYNTYLNSPSSTKKYSERLVKCTTYQKQDKSHLKVYQLDSNGKLLKTWDSISEISEFFNIPPTNIRYYIDKQKIVGGTSLFVMMFNYKTTIDYGILFKYIKYKEKK